MEVSEKRTEKSEDQLSIVSLAKERFKLAMEHSREFREQAKKDLEFKIGQQWDEKLKRDREADSRPCLTINKLPQYSNQIVNDIRQNRPSLKVYPVDDKADVGTAKVIQGLFRNIEYQSSADVAYDTGVTSAVDTGLGYLRIFPEYVSPKSFNQKIKIGKIDNLFSVVYDHNSTEFDGSDAEFAFQFNELAKKEFKRKYPKITLKDDGFWSGEGDAGESWESKDTVRVADYFCREYVPKKILLLSNGDVVLEDELDRHMAELFEKDPSAASLVVVKDDRVAQMPVVMWYKLAGDEIAEKTEFPAPFIPIVPVYGSVVNINGKRYIFGILRFARDPQQMYNIFKSAETEAIALAPKAPYIGVEGQFEGFEEQWSTANVKTYAYLEYKNVSGAPAPQRQSFEPAIMAITQATVGANEDLKSTTSIFDASMGRQSNETSGVAIRGRQQQSQTANFHFSDNLVRSIRQIGRIGIYMMPKIYDTARVERILGEDGSDELVKLNQPFEKEPGISGLYNLTVGEYDVAVETGPSFATKRQEAAASILDFIRAYPAAINVVGDLLAKNMDWHESEEIANRLKRIIPPHILGEDGNIPPQVQAHITQMQQAIQLLQSELQTANLKIQTKELENQSKERMKAAELETDLMKEQMKLSANPTLPDVVRQLAELQAVQTQYGWPTIPQNFNRAPLPMDASGMAPQQNNPTGGFSPG